VAAAAAAAASDCAVLVGVTVAPELVLGGEADAGDAEDGVLLLYASAAGAGVSVPAVARLFGEELALTAVEPDVAGVPVDV
jgi:hypothetical protein